MYKGSLVNLRPQAIADMAILAEFQNQEYFMETNCYEMPRFTYKEKLEKEYKERFQKHHDNDVHLIIETIDGKVIGAIGLHFVFWKNGLAFMYQYIGDAEYQKGGYQEEALKLFTEFVFMELNVRKLSVHVQENDTLSLEVLKTIGFNIEVTHEEDVLCHGKYLDVYDMAMFMSDYKKRSSL